MPVKAGMAYAFHDGGAPQQGRPPLILIHGAGGSRLTWPAELRRLPDWPVYALDLPGHGRSPGAGADRIAGYSERVLSWMDALGLPQAVWLGHSMGGGVALHAALNAPQRVAALVLVGTGGRLRVHPDFLAKAADPATCAQAVQAVIHWSFAPGAPAAAVERAQEHMLATPPDVLHADFLACDRFDVLDRLAEVEAPALVLCGAEDRMTPPKYSRFLAERIPAARLVIIEGAGHMVMLEKPGQVAQAVQEFLRGLQVEGD